MYHTSVSPFYNVLSFNAVNSWILIIPLLFWFITCILTSKVFGSHTCVSFMLLHVFAAFFPLTISVSCLSAINHIVCWLKMTYIFKERMNMEGLIQDLFTKVWIHLDKTDRKALKQMLKEGYIKNYIRLWRSTRVGN